MQFDLNIDINYIELLAKSLMSIPAIIYPYLLIYPYLFSYSYLLLCQYPRVPLH